MSGFCQCLRQQQQQRRGEVFAGVDRTTPEESPSGRSPTGRQREKEDGSRGLQLHKVPIQGQDKGATSLLPTAFWEQLDQKDLTSWRRQFGRSPLNRGRTEVVHLSVDAPSTWRTGLFSGNDFQLSVETCPLALSRNTNDVYFSKMILRTFTIFVHAVF